GLLRSLPAVYDPTSPTIRRIRAIYRQEERKPRRSGRLTAERADVLRRQLMAKVFGKADGAPELVACAGISVFALAKFAALHAIREAGGGRDDGGGSDALARRYAVALAEGGVTYPVIAYYVSQYKDATNSAIREAKTRVKRGQIDPAIQEGAPFIIR